MHLHFPSGAAIDLGEILKCSNESRKNSSVSFIVTHVVFMDYHFYYNFDADVLCE